MTTFYVGKRPILKIDSDAKNTFTGKFGVYSNWQLMSPNHVLDGAPDLNVLPGTNNYPHDLQMSRWFLGLDPAGTRLADPGILYPDVYSGRWNTWLNRSVAGAIIWNNPARGFVGDQGANGYGHLFNWGGTSADTAGTGYSAAYASLGYFYYGLINVESGALKQTSTLGHLERYPNYKTAYESGDGQAGQASTFGAFEPYIYKGLISKKSDPLSSAVKSLGHTVPPVRTDPINQTDVYGFEHVQEYFGVPSCRALDV